MENKSNLDVFLNPASVAVIGASDRLGSWGSNVMDALLEGNYSGKLFPVNARAETVKGITAFNNIMDIKDPVELAIIAIPSESVEEIIRQCGKKQVKGVTIITAGYGESIEGGYEAEEVLTNIAHSHGMRLVGPNVSGMFNLHNNFTAVSATGLYPTSLAGISQGGFAFYDLLRSASPSGMGVGRFIHTGNECDLTVTDFLQEFGNNSEIKAILMYLETLRNGRRFIEVARKVTKTKPVVVHKAGSTSGGARAAQSHTGALATSKELVEGLLNQAGVIISPTMELMVPLVHALLERPPLKGTRVAVITVGGSWGVTLSDALEAAGLHLPLFSENLQNRLRLLGMPARASTKNPVDIGAAGMGGPIRDSMDKIGHEILASGEVDALVLHGFGRAGRIDENSSIAEKMVLDIDKKVISTFNSLEKKAGLPVLIGCHHSLWNNQAVWDLSKEGIRFYHRLDEIGQILMLMHKYYKNRLS